MAARWRLTWSHCLSKASPDKRSMFHIKSTRPGNVVPLSASNELGANSMCLHASIVYVYIKCTIEELISCRLLRRSPLIWLRITAGFGCQSNALSRKYTSKNINYFISRKWLVYRPNWREFKARRGHSQEDDRITCKKKIRHVASVELFNYTHIYMVAPTCDRSNGSLPATGRH